MNGIVELSVATEFEDGALTAEFGKLGYPSKWKPGKTRTLPRSLALRAKRSGALLVPVEDGMVEDKIIPEPKPTSMTTEQRTEAAEARQKRDPVIRVCFLEGFEDGNLAPEFAAANHPCEVGKGEIVSLPLSLIEKCEASGAEIARNPADMLPYEGHYQARFHASLKAWKEERAALVAEKKRASETAPKVKALAEIRARMVELERHPYANAAELKRLDTEAARLEKELQ